MSETKTIKTLSSADSASELLVRKNGEVAAAPLSSLVAPAAKLAEGLKSTTLVTSSQHHTSNQLKEALINWVLASNEGAVAKIRIGNGFADAFNTDGATMPSGSEYGMHLIEKAGTSASLLYFSLLGASYASEGALYHLVYNNGIWSILKFQGTRL